MPPLNEKRSRPLIEIEKIYRKELKKCVETHNGIRVVITN